MRIIKSVLYVFCVSILFMTTHLPVYASDAKDDVCINEVKTIFSLDYDNNTADLLKFQGTLATPVIKTDTQGNKYAEINPSWGVSGYKFTDGIIDLDDYYATYKISYDFKLSSANDYANMSNIGLTNKVFGSTSGNGISSAFPLLRACSEASYANQFSVGKRVIPGNIYDAVNWYSYDLTIKTSEDKTKWEYEIIITDKEDSTKVASLYTYGETNGGGWNIPSFGEYDIDSIIFGCGDTVSIDNILVQRYEEREATLYFNGSNNKNISKIVCKSPASDGVYEIKNGVNCITVGSDICLYLNIDLNDDVFKTSKRDNVQVTVKYFDEGTGYFTLRYNNGTQDERKLEWAERVSLTNTNEWKTYTFKLNDILLNNSIDFCDFGIVAYSPKYGYSESPAYIAEVYVKNIFPDEPLKATLETYVAGNILSKNNESLHVRLNNITNTQVATDVEYSIYNEEGYLLTNDSVVQNYTIEAGTEKVLEFDSQAWDFGIYTVVFKIKAYTKGADIIREYNSERFTYSVVNMLDSGEKANGRLGVCLHNAGRDVWNTNKALISQIGIKAIRDSLTWEQCEKNEGVLEIPEDAGYVTESKELGMDNLIILGGGNSIYTETADSVPTTENEIMKWVNYVDWVTDTCSDKVTYYEIWNEANFKMTVSEYYNLLSVSYPVIKNNAPKSVVCGMVTAQVDLAFIEEVLKLGGGKFMDAISVHPYDFYKEGYNSWWTYIRDDVYKRHIAELRDLLDKYGFSDMPIILSEVGLSTADCVSSPIEQAAEIIQLCAVTAEQDEVEKIFLYDFQNDSYDTGEEYNTDVEGNFGLINHWLDTVPYSAKPSYVALAGYNKLLGDAEYIDGIVMGGTRICRFKRNADSEHVIIMWTDNSCDSFSLDLGAEDIEILDMYTNVIDNQSSQNGVYDFETTFKPIYVTGNISHLKLIRETSEDTGNDVVFSEDFEDDDVHTLKYYSGTEEQTKTEYILEADNKYLDVKTVGDWSIVGFDMQDVNDGVYSVQFDVKFSSDNSYTCLWWGDINSSSAQKGFTGCFGSLALINTENEKMYVCGQEIGKPQADVWYSYKLTINTKYEFLKGFKAVAEVVNSATSEKYSLDTYIGYSRGYYSGFPSDRELNKLMTSGAEGICIDNIIIQRVSGEVTDVIPKVTFDRIKQSGVQLKNFEQIENGTTKIWINADGADVSDVNAKMIAAYYAENGMLIDVELREINIFEDGRNIVDFYVEKPEGCKKIKFMCWSGDEGIQPMDASVDF